MSQNGSIRDTFFEECQDLLEALDEGLNQIADGEHDADVVNAVFRAVHSIKGGAGAFALDDLVSFAHTFETVFDEVRSERLALDDSLIKVLFRGADHLVELVEASRLDQSSDADARDEIIKELNGYLGKTGEEEEEEVVFEPMGLPLDMPAGLELPELGPTTTRFRIVFKPHPELYKNGHEPLFLFRSLSDLGELESEVSSEHLPPLNDIAFDAPYLSWVLHLETEQDAQTIEDVFEFVEGLCELSIQEVDGDAGNDAEPNIVAASAPDPLPSPDIEIAPPQIKPDPAPAVVEALKPKDKPKRNANDGGDEAKSKAPAPSLRVDPERVDRLINTVGELIINQSMLAQRVSHLGANDRRDLEGDLEDYKLLARDIQEGVMAIRAQPVKPLFRRMARIVREAAHATGKSVHLETTGENTEVDKTVIEGLVDPLTHMIRNAVDHGIETPENRREAGKAEIGTIHLSAAHRSGSVYIEIKDDGAGLNRPKIKSIAETKGLIAEGLELTDSEIDNLLFLPGFSTATEVSNLSGRGVGMDVVKNAVLSLGGRTSIASETGAGTTFSVVLPLTLAVMDGMVITVADQTMVVPISSIVETIRATPSDVHTLNGRERLLSIRGTFVPIVEVSHRLGLRQKNENAEEVFLLVETAVHGQAALSVSAIHDQRQVVVKSLEAAYGRVPGISAATILGDGKIAMILDPESIIQIEPLPKPTDLGTYQKQETRHAS